uniref:Uncharacterized protein n=1 Tax=Candidatus Kentrum sp. SD TaxID=2126332 RepID=A0A450Z9W4_9GAMM|nr:MAG: hypothetical protein BECKSD772E_GA0070983_14121 [Candidatus Kentron sp. SD]
MFRPLCCAKCLLSLKHWGKDTRIASIRKTGDYFRVSSWGVWWFRLEKMVWNYPRGSTSFRVYTRISRFYKAKPK